MKKQILNRGGSLLANGENFDRDGFSTTSIIKHLLNIAACAFIVAAAGSCTENVPADPGIPDTDTPQISRENNKIYYTTKNNEVFNPEENFNTYIVSNVYENGMGVITFEDDVIFIGRNAFYCGGGDNLQTVILPNTVERLGLQAFYLQSGLTSIEIPEKLKEIDHYAFSSKYMHFFYGPHTSEDNKCLIIDNALYSVAFAGIKNYTLPEGITTIKEAAIYNCNELESLTIPDSVTKIEEESIKGNRNLSALYGKFTTEDHRELITNDNCLIVAATAGLTDYNIPDRVTRIGTDGLHSNSCTSITISDSVTAIGDRAFFSSENIKTITIPENVKIIGNQAFSYCYKLETVYCEAVEPPMLGYWVFDDSEKIRTIYVPRSSVNAYKQAINWEGYADMIVGYDF